MIEYCQIELTKGQVARVSPEDWEELSKRNWYATNAGNGFYAVRKNPRVEGKLHNCPMHRAIMNPPRGMEVDHINRDTLDNRRENLRVVTRAQNAMNLGMYSTNTSGFTGVTYHRRTRKWHARMWLSGRRLQLGSFASPEEAHSAYCAAAIKHRGEFASI